MMRTLTVKLLYNYFIQPLIDMLQLKNQLGKKEILNLILEFKTG